MHAAALTVRTALLVPCYNATRFLWRLREQVDRLQPAFDEVLLADDASQDDTAMQAERFGFKILRLPKNLGPGGARNALARATTADWIHFHDVDDEVAPGYLARTLPVAQRGDCDLVMHFVDFIRETDRKLVIRWHLDDDALAADPAATLLRSPMPTMSSFVRRETFLAAGGFDEEHRCFEDGDLHFRLAASGARVALITEVLEWSLRHDTGAGANQHYCFKCRLAFLERYAATQPEPLHPTIAEQAERAAVMLLRFGDKPAARRAIALAERLGRKLPVTSNPLLKALSAMLPTTTALRLQDWMRND